MLRRKPDGRASDGQALVEFALVIPIFLALLFGVIDLGRVIWANDSLANAAREGARYASVHAGTPALTTSVSKEDIRTYTRGFAIAGGDATVDVCYSIVHYASRSVGCTGNTDEPNADNKRGNLVTVTVTSHIPVLTGAVLGFGTFTVTGTSTVLINN